MTEAEKRSLIDCYVTAYNRFAVADMLALFTDDVRFEHVNGDQVTASASGIEELRVLAKNAATMFREREQRVTAVEFQDEKTIATISYCGVLAVDLPGGPVAGSAIELAGTSEFTFRDGKICRLIDRG